MKFALAVLFSTALLASAAPQAAKTAPASTTPAPVKRWEIPQGAVERDPGRFFYTDTGGKKWIFVRTPFGISRVEDKAADAPDAAAAPDRPADPLAGIRITESGGVVTFERSTPFGVSKWQKKKSELDDRELAALARSREAAAKPPAKTGEGAARQDR